MTVFPIYLLSGFDLNGLADVDTWYPNPYNPSLTREVLERHDMARFYVSTGGSSWIMNDRWLNGDPVCGWAYVRCTSSNYVSSLDYTNNNLVGNWLVLGNCSLFESVCFLISNIPHDLTTATDRFSSLASQTQWKRF